VKKFFLILLCILTVMLSSCHDGGEQSTAVSEASAVTESTAVSAEESPAEESSEVIDDVNYNGVAQLYISTRGDIGRDEYIDCKLNLVDNSGKFAEITDNDAVIKVRGNSTSNGEKKPYNIKFSSSKNPLGLGEGKKFCLLANLFDKSLMRNKLSYDLASEIGGCDYTPQSEYIDVYLNDRFLGNYLMTQDIGDGKDKVDIDVKKNEFLLEYEPYEGYSNPINIRTPIYGLLLGFNEPENPTASQLSWIYDFLSRAEAALQSRNIAEIKRYFDLDSFVDFYIVSELFKNIDFATSSTRFYIKGGKLYAGPIWDLDLSAGNVSEEYDYGPYNEYWNKDTTFDSTEGFYCRKLWYGELFECKEFKELFEKRYAELSEKIINLTTDNKLGKNRIDLLIEKYGKSFQANYSRAGWMISRVYGAFETRYPEKTLSGNIESLREWLIKRHEWIMSACGHNSIRLTASDMCLRRVIFGFAE